MRVAAALLAYVCALGCAPALAVDANILLPVAELQSRLDDAPFEIVSAKPARGLAVDVALKTEIRFDDGTPLRVKLRPANPGASEFNNEPRFELAAHRLQRAFLDGDDMVVPPTALRMLPRAMLRPHAPTVKPTFRGSSQVLVVVQYWLHKVSGPVEIWDPQRFKSDPAYARHIANLNVLTYLIRHGDSNAGNVMLSTAADSPRAFAVDNGVAFSSPAGDRGSRWRDIRVPALPAATVERLRALDAAALERELGVLATWQRSDDTFEPVPSAPRLQGMRGVRMRADRVQLGLTPREIRELEQRRRALLARVDSGELGTF
jgi:hypothetical protein